MNETMTTVVGNVITNIAQRRIGDGTRVASFRMASNERRFDKETQQWVNGDSLYVTVTCWRKLALGVNASLVKGDPVIVTGRLFTRGYEVEGQKRSVTELEAVAVGPDLSRCMADVSRARRQASEDAPAEVTVEDGSAAVSHEAGPHAMLRGAGSGSVPPDSVTPDAVAPDAVAPDAVVSDAVTVDVAGGDAAVSSPADIPEQAEPRRQRRSGTAQVEESASRLAGVGAS